LCVNIKIKLNLSKASLNKEKGNMSKVIMEILITRLNIIVIVKLKTMVKF